MSLEEITVAFLILVGLAVLAVAVIWLPRAVYRTLIRPRVYQHRSLRWLFWITLGGLTVTGGLLLRYSENPSSRDWLYALIAASLTLLLDGLVLYAELRRDLSDPAEESDQIAAASDELLRRAKPIEPK
jgi:hypothetical protein